VPRLHMTDLAIRTLKPNGSQALYYCDQTPNFGVRINQSGTKTFFVNLGNDRRRVSLGRYPATSLQQARHQAKTLLLAPASLASSPVSIQEALETYRAAYVVPNYKPHSGRVVIRSFRHLQHLKTQPIAELSARQIHAIMDSLKATPSEANHLFAALKTFLNWCKVREYIATNPIAGTSKPYKETPRTRILTLAELAAVWKACRGDTFGRLIKSLILTAARRGELCNLKWVNYSPRSALLVDTKNGLDHTLPVTPRIRAIIETQARSGQYVFPCKLKDEPFNDFKRPKDALDKRAGVTDYTIHDLRRTAASIMASLKIEPHLIERILNHAAPASLGGVIGTTYNRHQYQDEMRDALLKYHAHIDRLLSES
jgi:integrase